MTAEKSRLNKIRIIITVSAAVAVVIGIVLGEASAVYQKAVRICMECIGLG